MTTDKKQRLRAAAVLVAASFIFTLLLFETLPTVLKPWDLQTGDALFLLRQKLSPPPYDSSIVHIDIGNSSIQKLSYYFPRRLHAQLLDVVGRMNFSAIAYDIIFAQRLGTDDDSLMLSAAANSQRMYVPVAFQLVDSDTLYRFNSPEGEAVLDASAWELKAENTEDFYRAGETLVTWPELSLVSRGIGFISVKPDADGVFRRVPLLIRYKKDRYYPSMVFRLACDQWRVAPENIEVDGNKEIIVSDALMKDGSRKDIHIPIDRQGNLVINWIGPWETMTHFSFVRMLQASEDSEEIDAFAEKYGNSTAFVGDNSTGISDVGPTPFERDYVLVGLHANTLNTLLTDNFLSEAGALISSVISLVLIIILIVFSVRLNSVSFTVSSIGLIVFYLLSASAAFIYGHIIFSIIKPTLSIVFSMMGVLVYRYMTEEKEKEQLRARFESYFPPQIVKMMLENPGSVTTSPRLEIVTIMFSDIKSFTTHSSHMTPEEISATLSEYFEAMTSIVFDYGGTVDKFIGDGLMVFYGAPEPQPDHAVRCVKAAIEMQKKCKELKARWEPVGRLPLKIRIGINSGSVIVGDLGSERRKEYTVLGSDVNLAQRLESNAPVEGILISEATYKLIKDQIPTRARDPILVKGLDTPIIVYEVPVE